MSDSAIYRSPTFRATVTSELPTDREYEEDKKGVYEGSTLEKSGYIVIPPQM
jgi:hypothetical protein